MLLICGSQSDVARDGCQGHVTSYRIVYQDRVVQDKLYITEEALLRDSYRLGVSVANSGFRPTFIVGP